ncbi:Gfo/Idh/MocA family oxidoreductase [Amycolatopsis sp. NPDC004079]|uniref:Gfo/Idh/MocA family protein n=1 Tax=Amycolatopsis sp. NPDC004079 TaxID=3154549 RepID=UPI0033AD9575
MIRPDTGSRGGRTLRAGVIGLGKQALEDHIPGLRAADSVELTAVCDEDPQIAEEQGRALEVPWYADAGLMLAGENLDFVVICVPHDAGARLIEMSAKHGVHVLKEKPFATSLEQAEWLTDQVEQAGIHLMVTMQRRFNPIYTSFLQLVDQIGQPFVMDAAYTLHIADPSEGWRGHSDRAGGGCLIDMGYHMVDMLLWYFGLPDRVMADVSVAARPDLDYDAEDTALVQIGYDSGLYGSMLLSRAIGPKTERIRVTGSKGIVSLERGRISRLTSDGEIVESLVREQAWPAASVSQINHFSHVIKGERPNPSRPADHISHLRFIHACYQSARTHAAVTPMALA